ncbi:MAG TPA: TauD/TfdA family dioxygenase [Streptosporangiaceae bacterium]|nr:TauD/TfdA family dioxygenase [Streptosporangiaceae bacterium]
MTGHSEEPRERPDRSGKSELPLAWVYGPFGLPAIWLRDNCRCAECRDPGTGARLTSVSDLSANVVIAAVHQTGNRIEIEFGPDRHTGVYDADWLGQFGPAAGAGPGRAASRYAATAGADDGRSEDAKQLWDAAGIAGAFPQGSWPLYWAESAHRQACLRAVLRDGFVVLTDMPREADAVLAVAQSIGAVRETECGRVVDVRARACQPAPAGRARPMALRTAAPFRDPLLTVMVLGCLDDGAGGAESTLVDGFRAAATLRAEHPARFAVLAGTPVTFARADAKADLRATRPVISVDLRGRIREVHFASRYLSPLRGLASEIVAFYDAYRSFVQLLGKPELALTFRLRPGDCLILDNTRILHGRTGVTGTGQRHLQKCWTDLDGLASSLAVLERPQHNGSAGH